jgi:hypothetical protein
MADRVDEASEQLYGVSREEFTPLRTSLAKAAKADGDADAAVAIGKLGKPTTSAWLANQLARHESELVQELTELGDQLRDATDRLAGDELRTLSRTRNDLIRSLVRQAGSLAGAPLSESVTRELEDMLTTAVADQGAGAVLRAGRIATARDLSSPAGWPALAGAPAKSLPAKATPKPRAESTKADKAAKVERARAELEEARAAVKQAEADRVRRERALAEVDDRVREAQAEVRKVIKQLDAAEEAEREARKEQDAARRAVKGAERDAGMAWRRVQQAERVSAHLADD